jgi:hypothetical protein
MACHEYNNRYYKMLTIASCDMHFEDGATQLSLNY